MEDDSTPKVQRSSFTFTYHDPSRNFDGTPYEAAAKAVLQVDAVARLLQRALIDTNTQARNAFMQRNLDLGEEANAQKWVTEPEARILAGQLEVTSKLRKRLPALIRAVGYDPNNPPKEED